MKYIIYAFPALFLLFIYIFYKQFQKDKMENTGKTKKTLDTCIKNGVKGIVMGGMSGGIENAMVSGVAYALCQPILEYLYEIVL